jgi:large subunit ribosomal protein L21
VDRLDAEPGTTLTLDRVLLVADGDTAEIGRPVVANASVSAAVVGPARGDKVVVFKYKPKARRRVKKGHRSELTVLRITDITLDGRSAAGEEAARADARKTERDRLAEAAARQAKADAELAKKLEARTEASTTEEEAAPKSRRATAKPASRKQTKDAAAPGADDAKPARSSRAKPAPSKAEKTAAEPETKVGETETKVGETEKTADAQPPKRTRRTKPTTEE